MRGYTYDELNNMPSYYFNMETTGTDFREHKIISIQYQMMDTRTGEPFGDFIILKEWESSEEEIVRRFQKLSNITGDMKDKWNFVMVGDNLNLDKFFLWHKFKKYLNIDLLIYLFREQPTFDINNILVLLNRGAFKNAKLCLFKGEEYKGKMVPEWYRNKEYDKIVSYIKEERDTFFDFYSILVEEIRKIPKLKKMLPHIPE